MTYIAGIAVPPLTQGGVVVFDRRKIPDVEISGMADQEAAIRASVGVLASPHCIAHSAPVAGTSIGLLTQKGKSFDPPRTASRQGRSSITLPKLDR